MKIDWEHVDIMELAAIVLEIKRWSAKEGQREKSKVFSDRLMSR